MDPLLALVQFIHGFFKLAESAVCLRDGTTANIFHLESILPVEGLGVHGNPGHAETHGLQHANHIPTVHVVAYGHHAVCKEFPVPADLFPAFDPEPETDAVYGETDHPDNQIDQAMQKLEFDGRVERGLGLVKADVLVFPADGCHAGKGVFS